MKVYLSAFLVLVFSIVSVAQETPEVVSTDDENRRTIEDVRETVGEKTSDSITLPPERKKPKNAPTSLEERKKKMVFYLDLLTKTETRSESLRKNLFEMIEKENSVKSQIRNVEYALRPEQLRNATALSGSLRPEQVRSEREKMLRTEVSNLNSLLRQIETNRTRLERSLQSADLLTERVRKLFEFYVDSTIEEELSKIR